MHCTLMRAAGALVIVLGLSFAVAPGRAQTTAGTSTTIVVPVVAKTVSFVSEVTLFNPNAGAIGVAVSYYDANNLASAGPKTCTAVNVPAGRSVAFALEGQCTLEAGNHYGLLVLSEQTQTQEFHGYVRTQNPQGIGFSVEGFPVEHFSDATSHATGLRRQAEAGGMPAFQTNCFAASLSQAVAYELRLIDDTSGVQIGSTVAGSLQAYQQVRYLEVFGAAGVNAGPGDFANVRAQFSNLTGNGAPLIGFCTVQENRNFAADFRIAKSYAASVNVPANVFVQGGNAFGTTAILGTTDPYGLEIRTNNKAALRLSNPTGGDSPNVIGGSSANFVSLLNCGTVLECSLLPPVMGATIGGGGQAALPNRVTDRYGTIGGGVDNLAGNENSDEGDAPAATVSGGEFNRATGGASTVGGGFLNEASANDSTVAGGFYNRASGISSTVPGGSNNEAAGKFSFAAGTYARALHDHTFVWGGSADVYTDSQGAGEFVAYAPGAVRFYAGAGGCVLTSGASGWSCSSDRALKTGVVPVDARRVLERVNTLTVAEWRFASVPGVRHMGPMAQDFHAAFGLGDDPTKLSAMDVQGVALAAIQGLYELVRERDAEIAVLKASLASQQSKQDAVRHEIASLRRVVDVLIARTAPTLTPAKDPSASRPPW
jgi:hypothetical protein